MSVFANDVTDNEFEAKILNQGGIALVDFWAPWCAPCRTVAPLIEKIAKEFDGEVSVYKLNVDENPVISSQLHIRSIPTIIVFKDGEILKEFNGQPDPHQLVDLLEDALASGVTAE